MSYKHVYFYREYKDISGKLDRIFGPAYIEYWPHNKRPHKIMWYQHGIEHRIGGPSSILYNQAGEIMMKIWYQNGLKHRIDGPAYIQYSGGNPFFEEWYQNGVIHRLDGPAKIQYSNGKPFYEEWYQQGRLIK